MKVQIRGTNSFPYTGAVPKGEYLQYGGQAIIEGVMMRSPRYFSIACRAPNQEIVVHTEAIEKTWIGRQKWLKFPFLRGSLALIDSMALGTKAMRFAANVQTDPKYASTDDKEPTPVAGVTAVKEYSSPTSPKSDPAPSTRVQDATIGGALLVSFVIGIALFNYLPNTIAELTKRKFAIADYRKVNVVAELVKAVIFFGYIALIGLLPDIREVFKYHGAEHKAINALEHDRPLELNACQNESRIHPRCGTSFAIIVLLIGFLLFAFVPRYPLGEHVSIIFNVTVRIALEICILPLIAGVSYELLRFAGKFRDQAIVNAAFQPGMWTQRLTTREPELKHVEVAIAALQACLDAEQDRQPPAKQAGLEDAIESAPPIPGVGL